MQLRVFISSTMKDLRNERQAVCEKLKEFGLEPVNAEGWLPDGARSWDRIVGELRSSDLFVLLLGDGYGYVPSTGPGAGRKISVTEMEYLEARDQRIPVLPFLKKLTYQPGARSSDEKKRDAFRNRIMEWERGYFIGEFDLASDLAVNVGKALIGYIVKGYKERIQERIAVKAATDETVPPQAHIPPEPLLLPYNLVHDVMVRGAVLFAGAGMSISAGLPTAAAFAEYLKNSIKEIVPEYPDTALPFAAVAADFEAIASRDRLIEKIGEMLNPPQGLQETAAHRTATHAFDIILTTNWDNLFEQALLSQGDNRPLVASEVNGSFPPKALVKLHGSLQDPLSPLITETDISQMDHIRAALWAETLRLLREKTVVIVGTSLRDPSIVRLFENISAVKTGYFIAPAIDAVARARLKRWNLIAVEMTSDAFFAALKKHIG